MTTTAERRVRFSEHCWRNKKEIIHKVLLWKPMQGNQLCGRQAQTFFHQLIEDTKLLREQLQTKIENSNA